MILGFIAGCGDDDDDGGGESLTKAEFIEQADAICAAGDAELDEAAGAAFGESEPDPAVLESFIDDEMAPNLQQQFDDIRDLGVPDEIDGGVESLLEAAEERLGEVQAMTGEEVLELFSTGEDPFADVSAQADALGFSDCGSGA